MSAKSTSHRITKSRSKTSSKASKSSRPSQLPSMSASTSNPSSSPSPIFFWRPHEPHGYLGQWHPSPFTIDSSTYATAEMWMMVSKARLFGDEAIAAQMLATNDPREHKKLGRLVRGFSDEVWHRERYDIVLQGTMHKFTLAPDAAELRRQLLATGDAELVEASPLDRIWGVGYGAKNAEKNRAKWGQNLLGKALMEARGRLREMESEKDGKKGKGNDGANGSVGP